MIIYLVHIRKYAIKKNDGNKRFFPIDAPVSNSEILVEVKDQFPNAFQYWTLKDDNFTNKTKVLGFKNIRGMFKHFEENSIDIGTTIAMFYKTKKEVPDETPLEGIMIYTYKNINIFGLRI